MKKCTKCNIEKELSDFSKHNKKKDGLQPICKSCVKKHYKSNANKINKQVKEYQKAKADKIKEYRKAKADKIKQYKKEWNKANANKLKEYYKANVDKINKQSKEYRKVNAEKKKEYLKEYYKANADKINKQAKKYYKENLNKIKEYNKENKDKINKYYKEYSKERKKTDPLFKFTLNTRNLIRGSFKRGIKNLAKSKRTEEILGCSIPFFCNYIKGQFTKGMTLENHGEWHLDHIKPVSVATTEEEVIELNHYTNFQPLWAFDNLSKNNKLVEKQLKFL